MPLREQKQSKNMADDQNDRPHTHTEIEQCKDLSREDEKMNW